MADAVKNLMATSPRLVPRSNQEKYAEREMRSSSAKASEDKQGGLNSDSEPKSLRQAVFAARREKEKVKGAQEKKIKVASSVILNYLWGLIVSVVGFIPGFLALNVIAFLKAIGLVKNIEFRFKDKVGLGFLNFAVIAGVLIIIGGFELLFEISTGIWGWFID